MARRIRPETGPSSSGPWTSLPERAPGVLTVAGPNGIPIFLRAKAFDDETLLESEQYSPTIELTPQAPGGGGGGSNPSPRVTWDEPTRFNTGPTDVDALEYSGQWRHTTETLIENKIFQGGLRIGGAPRTVIVQNFVIEATPGEGGNNFNNNLYGLTADPSFQGGTVIVRNGLVGTAASANIYMRYGTWDIEGVQFWDAGTDHIKTAGSMVGFNSVRRCYFGLMSNSYWNREYNDPTDPNYHNLSAAVHGDANQAEDVYPGVQIEWVGNSFDLVGTYAGSGGPTPPFPGWPIAAYSAAIFCVPRNTNFVGTAQDPPVSIEGNWIRGCTIPVRIGKPGEGTISHWRIKDNVWRPQIEFAPTQLVAGGVGEISGNIWEPTGANCDAWVAGASGPTP